MSAATIVSASREVIRHHGELHLASCPDGVPITTMCSHRTTVLLGCSTCHEAVFAMFAPGVPCHHLVEIQDGLTPSGIWTEVAE